MTIRKLYRLLKDGQWRRCVGPDGLHYLGSTPSWNRRDLWLHRINKRTGEIATGSAARTRRAGLHDSEPTTEFERQEREYARQLVFVQGR